MYFQIYLQSYEKQEPPLPNSACFSCNVTVFRFSPLILSRTKLTPRLTSKILQIRLTARIGEEGQSYQHQSHVGFHRDVWSEVEVAADLGEFVRTCRQPGCVFS
jgi:hypothetical protein